MATLNTISKAAYYALKQLDKTSTLKEIETYILDYKLYNFGAKEENISDVIRNAIERKCSNLNRKDLHKEKLFFKEESKTYGLLEWSNSYAVIVENDESQWNDKLGVSYHFPNKYLKILQPGTKVIYYKGNMKNKSYEEKRLSKKAHYFGIAIIDEIIEDPKSKKSKYAIIKNFKDFEKPILIKDNDDKYLEIIPENKLGNYWRDGVRKIDHITYNKIVEYAIQNGTIKEHEFNINANDIDNTLESIDTEGKKKKRYSSVYERKPHLREKALLFHGYTCKVCNFNFEEFYGEYAKDFIHVHHTKPLYELEDESMISAKDDLIPVCPNCHSIIHRRKNKTLTIEELQSMIKGSKKARR